MQRSTAWLVIVAALAVAGSACHNIPAPSPKDLVGLEGWVSPVRYHDAGGRVGFLVVGDWGTGDRHQRRVAASAAEIAGRHGYTFAISLGDNFYPAGVSGVEDELWQHVYESTYGALGLPFLATLGNHDWRGDGRSQWKYRGSSRTWTMPAPYYAYRVGEVLFIALDTTRWAAAQRDYVATTLDKNRDARWVIVYGHHPLRSTGSHGPSATLTTELEPLLHNRAHLYLAGHDHHKELVDEGHFPKYAVAGAAGKLRSVRGGPNRLYAASSLGLAGVSLTRDTLTFRFYDADGRVEFEYEFKHPPTSRIKPGICLPVESGLRPTSCGATNAQALMQ